MLNEDNETMINSSNEALSTYIPEYETTTDTLPLTITALEDPISEFIRYGKCTQTGTPSPTVPAPIMCNCGEITHEMLGYQYDTDEEIEDETIVHKDYTPETITIVGKNWFTGDWTQGSIKSADGAEITSNYRVRTHIKINPSTQYTISAETNTNAQYIWTMQYQSDGTYLGSSKSSGSWQSLPYTLTTDANASILGMALCKNTGSSTTTITPSQVLWTQVEVGDEDTDHVDNAKQITIPPLFSLGNTKDELDLLTGKITRRIGYKIFDGTEDWSVVEGSNAFRWDIPDDEKLFSANPTLLCTHFTGCAASTTTANMPDGSVKGYSSNAYVYFKYNTFNGDLGLWQNWLWDQYEAGTPVIMFYVLTTPEIELVEWQTANTVEGSNIIITDAKVSSPEIKLTYITG